MGMQDTISTAQLPTSNTDRTFVEYVETIDRVTPAAVCASPFSTPDFLSHMVDERLENRRIGFQDVIAERVMWNRIADFTSASASP